MKSEHIVVRALACSIIDDIADKHPSIMSRLESSKSRLLWADHYSGLSVYTIILPKLAKFLERGLDLGSLKDVPRPGLGGPKSKGDVRPSFFHELWSLVFEADGTLRDDCCEDAIACLRQLFLFAKKLRLECKERFTNETVDTFAEIERSLPQPWDQTWSSDTPSWHRRRGHPIWGDPSDEVAHIDDMFDADPLHAYDLDLDWDGFGRFTARVISQLGELNVYSASEPSGSAGHFAMLRPKHGPGAVSDRSDHTKYDFKYWTQRLECVFPYDHFGAPNSGFIDLVEYREFSSQLHAVPKTATGPRLIASEPTAHQFLQGGIANWIERQLAMVNSPLCESINLRDQDASRELAREASRSGSHATVDLSSASDRLTCRLVEYVFQSNRSLLDAMHACRTRAVAIDLGGRRETILLRKFATQGSALTFPIQTIVFTLIAVWSLALTRGVSEYSDIKGLFSQVRVFGDDIIVPTDAYPVLTRMLSSLLLSVNIQKSFAHGKFREACGMDAYNGVDVTPAYVRQVYSPAATALKSVVECSNNFHRKGWFRSAQCLLETVPQKERKLLPFVGPRGGAFGILTFSSEDVQTVGHLKHRYNHDLQIVEVKVLDTVISLKRNRAKGHGDLTQFFYEFVHSESLVDIIPYSGGQVAALSSRKTTRWVDKEKLCPEWAEGMFS